MSRRALLRGGATVAGCGRARRVRHQGTELRCLAVPRRPPAAATLSGRGSASECRCPPLLRRTRTSRPPRRASTGRTGRTTSTSTTRPRSHPTIDAFTAKTGIKVTYTEDVNDNDEYFAKIQPQLSRPARTSARDIFVVTDWMAGRLIRLGWVAAARPGQDPQRRRTCIAVPGERPASTRAASTRCLAVRPDRDRLQLRRRPAGAKVETHRPAAHRPALKGKVTAADRDAGHRGPDPASTGQGPERLHRRHFDAAIDKLQKAGRRQADPAVHRQRLRAGLLGGRRRRLPRLVRRRRPAARPTTRTSVRHRPTPARMLWSRQHGDPEQGPAQEANAETLMNYYYDPAVAAQVADYVNYICPVRGRPGGDGQERRGRRRRTR